MARGRELMTEWVIEALQQLGGSGTILGHLTSRLESP